MIQLRYGEKWKIGVLFTTGQVMFFTTDIVPNFILCNTEHVEQLKLLGIPNPIPREMIQDWWEL